jgi:hypothetical protein
MPDLKSELKKLEALSFNDDGETQQETNMAEPKQAGISVRFFNIIRDNPGSARRELLAKARAIGVAQGSSSTLLTQFCKRGLVRTVESNNGYNTFFSVGDYYKPGYVKKAASPKAVKAKPVREPAVQDVGVQDLLNTMPITKARALYDELKKIFGG